MIIRIVILFLIFMLVMGMIQKALRPGRRLGSGRQPKALDRLQPVIQNLATDGGTWNDFHVTYEQILSRVAPIVKAGAPALWAHVQPQVAAFFGKA